MFPPADLTFLPVFPVGSVAALADGNVVAGQEVDVGRLPSAFLARLFPDDRVNRHRKSKQQSQEGDEVEADVEDDP